MKPVLFTAAGNPENQDRGLVIADGLRTVLCVADGAGGLSGGAQAASSAIEMVRQGVATLNDAESCVKLLEEMDMFVAQDKLAGETTCALAIISQEHVLGASVGDSGIWLIHQGGFLDVTQNQPRKPFIGSGRAWPASFAHQREPGQILLLATDGLFKYGPLDRIAATCRLGPPEQVVRQLIELVRYPSGALPDDVTVIVSSL